MLTIYVDADACPVKAEVVRVASRHALPVFIVSNSGMRPHPEPQVKNIIVGPEFDAADNWIAEHIAAGDIVITADIQLAARCLKSGAAAIGPTGKMFTDDNIGAALAMRELHSYLRESGETVGNASSFTKQDRSQFLQSLDQVIEKVRRKT